MIRFEYALFLLRSSAASLPSNASTDTWPMALRASIYFYNCSIMARLFSIDWTSLLFLPTTPFCGCATAVFASKLVIWGVPWSESGAPSVKPPGGT